MHREKVFLTLHSAILHLLLFQISHGKAAAGENDAYDKGNATAVHMRYKPGELFHRRVDCSDTGGRISVVDEETMMELDWICVSPDGKSVYGFVPEKIRGNRFTACVKSNEKLCDCFDVAIDGDQGMRTRSRRKRRSVADLYLAFGCPASSRVTKAEFALEVTFNSLSASQKTSIQNKVATFFGVTTAQVYMGARSRNIYLAHIREPNFIASGRSSHIGTLSSVTSVEYFIACNEVSANDNRVTKLKNAVDDSSLSQLVGYPVIAWSVVSGYQILPTTLSPSTTKAATTTNPPISSLNVILTNTTFRQNFQIPADAFRDSQGGGTRAFTLYLYQSSGQVLGRDSWISLNQAQQTLNMYTSLSIYNQQPTAGYYKFRLSVMNSAGQTSNTELRITLNGPVTPPNYLRTLQLSSTTNVIVTSYKEVDILFLLQSKLAPYLSVNSNDMVNSVFTLTRSGNTALFIQYKFSTRSLVANSCDLASIISLRGKLDGATAQANLRNALSPQFSLTSATTENFQLSCRHLSSAAATVMVVSQSFTLKVGQYFSYSISRTSFLSSMRLSLELRFQNNTKVPSNYWIGLSAKYLDQNAKIHGLARLDVATNQQTTHSFKLVALTPILVESDQTFSITLPSAGSTISKVLFSVTMTQRSVSSSSSYIAFSRAFLSYISSYLGYSQSSVIIISYSATASVSTVVSWTISTLSKAPCDTVKINEVRQKLLKSDGTPNTAFQTGLLSAASFSAEVISIKLSGVCDPPSVNYRIPTLYIPQYGSLSYVVPNNAFRDGNDGASSLTLSFLQQNGDALPSTSWIWFNSTSRLISGYPFTATRMQTFNYILRAVDSDGVSAQQNVVISLNWVAPQRYLSYLISFSYGQSLLPVSNVITMFIARLKSYFQQSIINNIIIDQTPVFILSSSRIRLYYQNTSLRTDICDVIGHNSIFAKMRTGRRPSAEFIAAMQPLFTVEDADVQYYGKCRIASRNPPYFNLLDPEGLRFFREVKYVPYCDVASYLVPQNLFMDEEEGNTRNLKLSLLSSTSGVLPTNSWVNINITLQTIYAIADDSAYKSGGTPEVFNLRATDSDNKVSIIPLKFTPKIPSPMAYYNVTMNLNVNSGLSKEPYVLQIALLLSSLKSLFPAGPSIHVRSYRTVSTTTAVFVWSPCNMSSGVCNSTAISAIRGVIFQATAGTAKIVNANLLNSAIDKRFRVTSVSESLSGPCVEEPPTINAQIPTLNIGFCGPFSYQIPSNTFTDKQDGNTNMLTLNLVKSNGETIGSEFWLQFDPSQRLITAVLTQSQGLSSYPKQHSFTLMATDSTNLSTNMTINVVFAAAMTPYSHRFTIQARVSSMLASTQQRSMYVFATKLSAYLGDAKKNFQVITHTTAANNKQILTWSNCSLRYDPCDVLALKQIKNKLQNSFGTLQTAFQQALAPEFTEMFLSETNVGPCLTDSPPSVTAPFGPITVTSCQTYKAKIPTGTFYDREQGNTRNLALSLKNNNQNHWISFDQAKQELSILATNQIAASLTSSSVTVALVAADYNKQEAVQSLVIKISQNSRPATQNVTMQYRFQSLPSNSNFVSQYEIIRSRIIQYFSSSNILNSVEYAKLPSNLRTGVTFNAEWSSCSLPRDSCNSANLDRMAAMVISGTSVNPAFKTMMLQAGIDVTKTTFSRNGLCKDHITPPVVQNPIPTITISHCGYLAYRIPENTFYDNIDGNTRNLKLSLINASSNQAINSATKWISFNAKSQMLYVVLSDNSLAGIMATTLNFKVKAETKRGISVTTDLRLQLNKSPPNVSIVTRVTFAYTAATPPSRNEILLSFMTRFATYFNGNPNDFHYHKIHQAPNHQPYFIVDLGNCSLPSNQCDEANFRKTSSMLQSSQQPLPAFKTAMGNDVSIQHTQVLRLGACEKKNLPPRVVSLPKPISVQMCSHFSRTISRNTFYDEEDKTLSLSVTTINGLPVSGNYRWVQFLSHGYTLYGIITNEVLQKQPIQGYNLTIRASDSGGLYTETFVIVTILNTANTPQKYYQFSMQLVTRGRIRQQFIEERDIMIILNGYFKSNFTNILSYSTTLSNTINVRSSICTLPRKCDESTASSYFRKIITSQGAVPTEFASQFALKYTVSSTAVYRDPLCQGPLNPPVPKQKTWTITGSYCGGFNQVVPADLFTDPEDGNTRTLSLSLYLGSTRTVIPSNYWVQFNATSQVIYGWPTRDIATAYTTTSTVITLVAVDKTGQEGSIKVEFQFTQYQEPKYFYTIVHTKANRYAKVIDNTISFANSLRSYLRDTSTSSVGLIQHVQLSQGMHTFNYANCSVSYNPCDIAALTKVKNMLFTGNRVTPSFEAAMSPAFTVKFGNTRMQSPCGGTTNNPPYVKTRLTTIYISLCGMYTFRIPASTFYDPEEGDTRKLTLSLVDKNNRPLSSNSWMQFDIASQTLTAFATATSAASQPIGGYSFIVTATDASKLSASNSFKAQLYGPIQPLRDCQIQIVFNTDASLGASSSNNALSQIALSGISSYFKLSASEIGLVNFMRQSTTQFTFSWSYCSPSYAKYVSMTSTSSSQQTIPVDYKGLVTKVLMRLFMNDRKTVQTAFYSAFNQLTVKSVKTVFTGACSNIPPIVAIENITKLSYTIPNCGYRQSAIQSDLFYDYEDGTTFNLKLELLTKDYKSVGIESWANIDTVRKQLMMSMRDKERVDSMTVFKFYLQATDSKGKNATLPVEITKLQSTTTMSPFNITFEFTLASSASSTSPYVSGGIAISNVTSQLYALSNDGQSVITRDYTSQAGLVDSRSFTWLTCNYQQCSTSTVLQKTKQLHRSHLSELTRFKQMFQDRTVFTLQRVYYISSCDTPVYPPSPNSIKIELNITMCSPLTFQVPSSTFYDRTDGEMNNMRIRLLDSKNNKLPSNSWIQLNTATLQIYAIYQSSLLQKTSMTSSLTSSSQPPMQTSYFQLEATNSRGLKAYKQLKVNVLDYPYTSDCFTTLNVKRNFGSSKLADLDVLYKLVSAINRFYQDVSINIKVSKFQKTSAFSYSLVFSNCSFAFSTMKAAKWGLSESHRSAIAAIFSRMLNANGSARSSFTSHLASKGFTLTSIQASYSCIESPPIARVEKLRAYAYLCTEFKDYLSTDLFKDARDGTNLSLSLCYTNGQKVRPNEWVQLDERRKLVYGRVGKNVKLNIPSFVGYSYLIVATDSSGRTANVSYQIKIASAAPITDVTFVLGFTTATFNEYTKTADLLMSVTRKLGLYIDGNAQGDKITIQSYNAMNLLSWQNCTMRCNAADVTSVMQKLQKNLYNTVPSDAFKAAMAPELTPTYIYVNGSKCLPTTTEVITITYRIIIRKPICGFFSYTIPSDVFRSSLGQTTRQMLLTMTSSTGSGLSSSSIVNFHTASQSIDAVPVYTRLSSEMSYRVTATSSRSTTASGTTTLKINYQDYDSYAANMKTKKLCSFTATVTTSMNPDFTDVYILKKFIEKIAKYFNSNTQQRVSSMQRKMFRYSNSGTVIVSQAFANSLTPEFTLKSIKANTTTCTQPPNRPPQPKNPLTRITAGACGEFKYQIPGDFFTDEVGMTRDLNIEFLSSNRSAIGFNSWVVYDNSSQTISGLPLNETLQNQPQGGYTYVIKATDSSGMVGYAKLVIKIDGKPYKKYKDKELTLSYQTTIRSSYQMVKILAITRKISKFPSIGDPENRLRVISVIFSTSSRMLITVVNCTVCSPYSFVKYYDLAQNRRIQFNEYMKPEFPTAFSLTAVGICDADEKPYKTQGVIHNVTFCSTVTKLDFLQLLSINQLEPGTKLAIRAKNFQPLPLNSWFWFNDTSNVLEAFANENSWNKQPKNGTAFTWAIKDAGTNRVVSAVQEDRLKITDTPTSSGLQYTLTIETTNTQSTKVDAYFISIAFNILRAYLSRSDLQFVSLTRQQGSVLKLSIKFLVCGLPSDCTVASVKELDNKIFKSPGQLRPEFIMIFPVGFSVSSVTDNCKNQPPVIPKSLNLTISICGVHRYKISSNFASDFEDGNADNLAISLRTTDNLRLPRDSWIRFDETSREIIALPSENIVRTPNPNGWRFLIVVKDKGGKQAQATLTVFTSEDKESFYSLSTSFETVNTALTTTYLDIQVRFLTMLSTFFSESLSSYRLLSFAKSITLGPNSESFFIRFGNCSVTKHVCSSSESTLKTTFRTITSSVNNPRSQLSRYLSRYFKIVSAKNHVSYTIDKPPVVLNTISVIRVTRCGMLVVEIPAATFYDEVEQEGQTSGKLAMKLTFLNNTAPPPNYWMQLIGNKIYVAPYGDDVKTGTYYMKLTAKDHCGQANSTKVTVIVSGSGKVQPSYLLNMTATTTTTSSMPYPVYYVAQLKVALKQLLGDANYNTRVTSFLQDNNNIQMKFSNCSLPCDKNEISRIKSKMFIAYNTVSPTLVSLLRPFLNVTSVKEGNSKNCSIPQTLPPVANRSLLIEVPLCRRLNFTVPIDTFTDPEDGGTSSLSLSLLTVSRQPLSKDNWVQFDKEKQIIYGYPRVGGSNVQFQRLYRYILVATNKEGNQGSTPVTVRIIGDLPPVLYQLSLSGETTIDSSTPSVAQEITLILKIGAFFNDFAINDVAYSRSGNSIQFSWSFCSMRTAKCDCYKIEDVRRKLQNIASFQQSLKPQFAVTTAVTETLHGVCARTRSPELRYDRSELIVPPGQAFTYVIRSDKFYDFEDGFTRNLTLYAADMNSVMLDSSSWLKIQNYKICGLMTLYGLEQLGWLTTTTTRREYMTVARDRCGMETRDSFLVRLKTSVPRLEYKVYVYMRDPTFGKNCSRVERFIEKISNYTNVEKSSILVYNYTTYNATNGTNTMSFIIWGLRNLTEMNCRNETVQVIREKFIQNNDEVDPKFVRYMNPEFEVVDVKDKTSESCKNATIPIILPPIIPSGDFPWWIFIILLIIALLILLCCLLWICIPRCCPGCCGRCCGCCGMCCQPGGKYASLEEADGVAGKDTKDDKDGLAAPNNTDTDPWDYTADENLIKPDIDSDGDIDPTFNDGNDDGDNVIPGDGDNESGGGDNDSGGGGVLSRFTKDGDAVSQFSGVNEEQMNTDTIQLVETAPITFDDDDGDVLPSNITYPPLYSSLMNERRRSQFTDAADDRRSEDIFGDVLSKPRSDDDGRMSMAANSMENQEQMSRDFASNEAEQQQAFDGFDQLRMQEQQRLENDVIYNNASENDARDMRSRFDQYDEELSFQSTNFQESAAPIPMPPDDIDADFVQQRRLPRPSIDFSDSPMPVMGNERGYNNSGSGFDESVITSSEIRRSSKVLYGDQLPIPGNYSDSSFEAGSEQGVSRVQRRSSQSYSEEISTNNDSNRRQSLLLPGTQSPARRRSSVTRPVAIEIPVSALRAMQDDNNGLEGLRIDSSSINSDIYPVTERRRSRVSQISTYNNNVDRRGRAAGGRSPDRRRSVAIGQNYDDDALSRTAASSRMAIRRRSAPLLDEDFGESAGFDNGLRRGSSQGNLISESRMPMATNYLAQEELGYPIERTERRSSRSFVSEEFTDNNGRRISVVETIRDSPFGSTTTRRKSTTEELLSNASSSLDNAEQPIKMKLGEEDAKRLLKRGSIQLDDGEAGELRSSVGRMLSLGNYSGASDDLSRQSSMASQQNYAPERRLSNSSAIGQKNRAVKSGRRRRASNGRRISSAKVYQYEMEPRGLNSSYINGAYDSDSFV
eukprot:gene14171-15650_t